LGCTVCVRQASGTGGLRQCCHADLYSIAVYVGVLNTTRVSVSDLFVAEPVLEMDYNYCLRRLFKYPPVEDVTLFIEKALGFARPPATSSASSAVLSPNRVEAEKSSDPDLTPTFNPVEEPAVCRERCWYLCALDQLTD
jgi:hypothetical protein